MLTILALALALHRLPGFHNPVIWSDLRFSDGAAALTQYINYDKGAVGLLLLAIVAPRCRSLEEFRTACRQNWLPAMVIIIAVLALAMVIGLVRLDPKWSQYAVPFLIINLFFYLRRRRDVFPRILARPSQRGIGTVADWCSHCDSGFWSPVRRGPSWRWPSICGISVSLAGIGYATVYARSKRIEPAILTHFGLNALHFLFFTYPFLQKT